MNYYYVIFLCLLLSACGTPAAATTPLPAPTVARIPTVASPTREPPSPTMTEAPRPTLTPRPSATPSPTVAPLGEPVRLEIAAISLDREIVSVGLDSQRVPIVPNHDVGWYNLSAQPGQGENIVLWGHVLRFRSAPEIPAPFDRINDLALGAEVILYDSAGVSRRYVVTRQIWATPDQVEYILPQGREMVTLVSCIGDKVVVDNSIEMTHRLITIAEPAES